MVPLLLAIGFEKLSMPPIAILNIRHLISSINTQDLQELKDKVFSMETSREISNLLDKYLEESFSI